LIFGFSADFIDDPAFFVSTFAGSSTKFMKSTI